MPRAVDANGKRRLDTALWRKVENYLDARRILATRLRVLGPRYEELRLQARVWLKRAYRGGLDELRAKLLKAVRQLVDPLSGGTDGSGWQLGQVFHVSEVYYLMARLPEVESISTVMVRRADDTNWQESVNIDARSYPFFADEAVELTAS